MIGLLLLLHHLLVVEEGSRFRGIPCATHRAGVSHRPAPAAATEGGRVRVGRCALLQERHVV